MKTSHVVIGLIVLAAAGGGTYFYLNSPSKKRKWILDQLTPGEVQSVTPKINAMSDDEIKVVYKLLKKQTLSNPEMQQLEIISKKYNVFT